jgi:hypothetical protein
VLVLLLANGLLVISSSAFAQIYKCEGVGGGTVYQGNNCAPERNITIREWMRAKGNPKTYSGTHVTFNFNNVSIIKVYQILAGVTATDLSVYPDAKETLTKSTASLVYEGEPWEAVLHDLDVRYGVATLFKGHFMIVFSKRDLAQAQVNPPERTRDDVIYDAMVEKFQAQYPELNPKSSNYSPALIDRIKAKMASFRRRNPSSTASEALSYAVLSIMSN